MTGRIFSPSQTLVKALPKLSGWIFWSVAALFYGYEFLHRVAPSVLTSELRDTLAINDQQLGTISAMYFYAYATFQLPAGILVDKYGTKRILIIASSILTLGSFLFATTSSLLLAHISRFMIGMGSAFAFVGCLKIGAQWLALSSFPLVVGLTNLCGTLGALAGGTPLSYLVQHIGWRSVMLQISFMGIAITFLIGLVLQDKKSSDTIAPQQQDIPNDKGLLAGLALVMRTPQSWLIALYGALLVAPIVALPEMWGVEFLKIAYQIPATQASGITHTIFVGTAVGGPLIGWIVTFIHDKVDFMMLTSLGALVLLSIFLYWVKMPFSNLYITLFCYGILTTNMLLCFTLITRLHPLWAQGAAIGFTNMIIMACGGMAQHLVGWILYKLRAHHEELYLVEDYHIALSVLPFCLLLAISITFFMKSENKDAKNKSPS